MRIHVVGAGGHAREVLDIIEALADRGDDVQVGGIWADGHADTEALTARGYSWSGGVADLPPPGPDETFVIGIGSSSARGSIDDELNARGWPAATLVHPLAWIGSRVTLGPGTVIWPGARLTTNITLGRHVHINNNATVGHDAVLDHYATVNPLASISGSVRLGSRSTIGTGANVNQGLVIGAGSTVGAGAVVIEDVQPDTTVVGVPARPLPSQRAQH